MKMFGDVNMSKRLFRITTTNEIVSLFHKNKNIKLYGAGFYLTRFLTEVEKLDKKLLDQISCVMVSNCKENLSDVNNIPIVSYMNVNIQEGDCIFLTLGARYTLEVYNLLKDKGANVYEIDFDMFHREAYNEVKKSIQLFINNFPENITNLNIPFWGGTIVSWTCWWQGIEQAPELVKACIESQRRNLPEGVHQIIITKDNYQEYIALPDYIIEKLNKGYITLTTLSDIIRATLLYRYGGFWMDSTLLVLQPLDKDILNYPIYTRNLPETQYCTNVMWSGWFIYAQAGNKLFQFLSGAFYFYYSIYDNIKYYLTVDYIIAIACNMFSEVEKELEAIPYNNEYALELCKHLTENIDEKTYLDYVSKSSIQKLTYKLDWKGRERENTVYSKIIDREGIKYGKE